MTTNLIFEKTKHIEIVGSVDNGEVIISQIQTEENIRVYDLNVHFFEAKHPGSVTLKWAVPGIGVKGVWKPTSDFNKRIQADWELDTMQSRISIDAPVLSLFGNSDENCLTFACSNPITTTEMNASIREEDNQFYCHVRFFMEQGIENFKTQLRLDLRKVHFSECLTDVSKWWQSFKDLKPISVPSIAKQPVYSTWYQFHQNLDENVLLKECALASELGYKSIIIDDGWQTKDSNRGYDFTGDWQPDRIPEMAAFVKKIQTLGMKVALWYSVPFCGVKSRAYQRFKGKFLTEDHRWAPVFDPRYPEVREHLIGLYTSALRDWSLDGLKLDFIDDFRLYEDTPMGAENGRDYASINEAVDCLLSDVISSLKKINPAVFIEFRQKYTGPAMRKYGNMFRAFDCPGDAVMNRVRIADLRMYCGDTAVHADMITWHPDEPVEVAALQLTNIMFGVPQLSVMLQNCREDELNMIRFYTQYWNKHASILMNGNFKPSRPLAMYPIQKVVKGDFTIIGVHDYFVVSLTSVTDTVHLLNAQLETEIVIKTSKDFGSFKSISYDCQGKVVSECKLRLSKGLISIEVPSCGMIQLTR